MPLIERFGGWPDGSVHLGLSCSRESDVVVSVRTKFRLVLTGVSHFSSASQHKFYFHLDAQLPTYFVLL